MFFCTCPGFACCTPYLEIDNKLFNSALRGVVKYDDGRRVEISGARFDDYMAWDKKQQEKKRRDAISTEGHLLSEPGFGVQLAEKTQKRKTLRTWPKPGGRRP